MFEWASDNWISAAHQQAGGQKYIFKAFLCVMSIFAAQSKSTILARYCSYHAYFNRSS